MIEDDIVLKREKPLVSVVVPNYNYACYLPERIDSILRQTMKDFELILLDDASTDDSVAVLEMYRQNKHVSHIEINELNTGSPFRQWMKGILLARGKYIWIAEADDLTEPDFLETCVRLAERYEDVAVCYVGSSLIDSEGNVSRKDVNHWGDRSGKEFACFEGKEFAEHNLYWKNYIINASGVLFRREYAMQLTHSDFLKMRYCGDWQFWFEMAMLGRVIEVYQKLNYFRQHMSKVTVSSRNKGGGVVEDIEVVRYIEEYLPHLETYKKRLRRGLLYRKIKRLPIDCNNKKELYSILKDVLHADILEYHLERRNKYLKFLIPSLLTPKRDRLR